VLEDASLELVWRETGVPHKSNSGQGGFGSLVLTEVVPRSVRGQAILTDNPDGITWRLSIHPDYYFQDKPLPNLGDGGTGKQPYNRALIHVPPPGALDF
jgi:hypothetical protein